VRIAVIGATGVVGQEIVSELQQLAQSDDAPFDLPELFASAASAGEAVPWVEDEELVVEKYEADAVRGVEAAIVAVPAEASGVIVTRLRQVGATAIDLSRTHRDQAPLYFDGALAPAGASLGSSTLITLPSAEALQLARVVKALQSLGPKWARVTVLRAASGAGQAGVKELAESTGRLLNGQEPENPMLGHRLAFNAIPQVGAFSGATSVAEADLQREAQLLIGAGFGVACTEVWTPWFFGHAQVVSLAFASPVKIEEVRSLLSAAPNVKVIDDPEQQIFPMPSLTTGDEAVLVGRIRPDPLENHVIQFFSTMDNARASAAHAVKALQDVARAKGAH
jgi:aspartate-semialdehyde dehydrogenase